MLGTSSSDRSFGIATASDGSVWCTYGDLDGETNVGGRDVFLTKYNSNGENNGTGSSEHEIASE